MKSVFFVILSLFFVSGSNCFAKCVDSENSEAKCIICNETPCECEQIASGDSDEISIKRIILSILKKINYLCSDKQEGQECKHCGNPSVKKRGISQILTDILKKACMCEKEEEKIREIITKLVDSKECKKNPCLPHCDPRVQEVLRTILKKASGCTCDECPTECDLDPPRRNQKDYKYWFRTTKEAIRQEISDKYVSPQKADCPRREREKTCQDLNESKKYNKNKEVYKCAYDTCKKCKTCQRPTNLICPRYVTNDCPIRNKADLFSICADCQNCSIIPSNEKKFAILFCKGCKAVNSPFVRFTPTGHPFKEELERHCGVQIISKFLQINDFRETETKSVTAAFNPFKPKSKHPRKKCTRLNKKYWNLHR